MHNKIIQIITICGLIISQTGLASDEKMFFIPDQLPNKLVAARLGITPLHCAKTIKDADNLVRCGCDVNARDNDGLTPMQYMMYHNRKQIAVYLHNFTRAKFSAKDHVRIDKIIANKNNMPQDLHTYVGNIFDANIKSHTDSLDHIDSLLFLKSSNFSNRILLFLFNQVENPTSPSSVTRRYTPTQDIEIPRLQQK